MGAFGIISTLILLIVTVTVLYCVGTGIFSGIFAKKGVDEK